MRSYRHSIARKLGATGAVLALGLGVTACDDGDGDEVEENVEEGTEELGDEIEDGADELEDETTDDG